jgi:hypothetical protein
VRIAKRIVQYNFSFIEVSSSLGYRIAGEYRKRKEPT